MIDLKPTEEQSAIIEAAKSSGASLMVPALAGTGKTTTIRMLSSHLPTKSVLALAFNKKIAVDLEKVLPPHFTVKTMNGLGHSAYAQACGKRLSVDGSKVSKLVTAFSKEIGGLSDDEWTNLRNLVNRARSSGLIPAKYPAARRTLLPDNSFGWDSVAESLSLDLTQDLMVQGQELLCRSIDLALQGSIDFDDQIYMSVLFSGLYQKFHTVLVDEAQDLSPLNHLQLKKVTGQRLIVVGDPKQAIYAFRGADSSSMGKIRELRPDWLDLPLTLTYRCPKVIVVRQHSHAPEYRAAESTPEGTVLDFRQDEEWSWDKIPKQGSIAVICRNNAPLVSLAFKLIKRRIGINMLGRDFGRSLTTLLKKLCPEDCYAEEAAEKITAWQEKEVRLARAQDKEERVSRIHDQAESLLAVIDSGEVKTAAEILTWLKELFEEKSGQVTLSSGHKAKGLEWHTVIHLDPFRVPSKYSRLARDDGNEVPYQQEMNLKYVIETRTKDTLVLANLESFQ